MNYIAIISVLVVIIFFLLYISTSNKGWNCTENGCVYGSGGQFSSYDKCNSYCKSSLDESDVKKSCDNNNNDNNDNSYYLNPYQVPYQPYLPMGYGYYHPPSMYHHDNHWGGEKHHHHHSSGGGGGAIKNHNENNIIINSPTGPN